MDSVDVAVVGAGVVGLAIARALAIAGREVVVLEAETAIGTHTSSRNNEVVHAGFLYSPQSLRGRLCRRGRDLMSAYCAERGVAIRIVGKLMPGLDESEVAALKALHAQGIACGVADLQLLSGRAASELEPSLRCLGALHSPSTAIVDTHALMLALQGDAEARGAIVALASRATGGRTAGNILILDVERAGEPPYSLSCSAIVNTAGLGAQALAAAFAGGSSDWIPRVQYAKGSFFTYAGVPPFRHLVVPLGETLAMGAAFTLDLGNQGRFGGDLEWIQRIEYHVDPRRIPRVAEGIRRYWPDLDVARLSPGYAGIRPRCWGPADPPGDWVIAGPQNHGILGLVHLLGIESPGLTAALALGEHVLHLLNGPRA